MTSSPCKFLLIAFVILVVMLSLSPPARAATVEGVTFAPEVRIGEATVPLRKAAYHDVQPEDRYSLSYHPECGTELSLNGTPLVTIEGADFAAAYFGIRLGREPIDEELKKSLLIRADAR